LHSKDKRTARASQKNRAKKPTVGFLVFPVRARIAAMIVQSLRFKVQGSETLAARFSGNFEYGTLNFKLNRMKLKPGSKFQVQGSKLCLTLNFKP
jgi:hypothetical protein